MKEIDLLKSPWSIWFLPFSLSLCDVHQYSLIPTSCVFSFPASMDSHSKRSPLKTHVFLDSLNPNSHIHIYTHTYLHSNKQYACLNLKVRESPPVSHFHCGSICLICGEIWLDSDLVGCRKEEFDHHAVTFPSQLKSKQTTERNLLYYIILCKMYEQNIKPSGVCKHIFSELHFSLSCLSTTMCPLCII